MFDARLAVAAALFLAPCLASASESSAEVEGSVSVHPGPRNVISVAPFSFLLGAVGAEYERVVADPLSLTFHADYRWLSLPGVDGAAPVGASVVGLNVGAHFFLLGKAPSGLWLGPELGTIVGAAKDGNGTLLSALPRAALQIGYTFIADFLSLSLGAGVQMSTVYVLPAARMSLGFAF